MTFLEQANELVDMPYEKQAVEIAQALAAAYEQGIKDATNAAISFCGCSGEDITRELNRHYRTYP